jgi:hypothetical protein
MSPLHRSGREQPFDLMDVSVPAEPGQASNETQTRSTCRAERV